MRQSRPTFAWCMVRTKKVKLARTKKVKLVHKKSEVGTHDDVDYKPTPNKMGDLRLGVRSKSLPLVLLQTQAGVVLMPAAGMRAHHLFGSNRSRLSLCGRASGGELRQAAIHVQHGYPRKHHIGQTSEEREVVPLDVRC